MTGRRSVKTAMLCMVVQMAALCTANPGYAAPRAATEMFVTNKIAEALAAFSPDSGVDTNAVCAIVTNTVSHYGDWQLTFTEGTLSGYGRWGVSYNGDGDEMGGIGWSLAFYGTGDVGSVAGYGGAFNGTNLDAPSDATVLVFNEIYSISQELISGVKVTVRKPLITQNALGLARLEDLPDTNNFVTVAGYAAGTNVLQGRIEASTNGLARISDIPPAMTDAQVKGIVTNTVTETLWTATGEGADPTAKYWATFDENWFTWTLYRNGVEIATTMGEPQASTVTFESVGVTVTKAGTDTHNELGLARLVDLPQNAAVPQLWLQGPGGTNYMLKINASGVFEVYAP